MIQPNSPNVQPLGMLKYGVIVDEDWSWTTRAPRRGEHLPYSRALRLLIARRPELLSNFHAAVATGDYDTIMAAQKKIADAVLANRSSWFRSDANRAEVYRRLRDLMEADPMTILATLHE